MNNSVVVGLQHQPEYLDIVDEVAVTKERTSISPSHPTSNKKAYASRKKYTFQRLKMHWAFIRVRKILGRSR